MNTNFWLCLNIFWSFENKKVLAFVHIKLLETIWHKKEYGHFRDDLTGAELTLLTGWWQWHISRRLTISCQEPRLFWSRLQPLSIPPHNCYSALLTWGCWWGENQSGFHSCHKVLKLLKYKLELVSDTPKSSEKSFILFWYSYQI